MGRYPAPPTALSFKAYRFSLIAYRCESRPHTFTVTRKNVAGMEV
jgi:hypothetical protein